MWILKLPAKLLYYVSDEFNKIFIFFLCVSIQIAARISTGKSDMTIAHCWICRDLANVNKWKIMFDPSIEIYQVIHFV